jgi:hypothetical protein
VRSGKGVTEDACAAPRRANGGRARGHATAECVELRKQPLKALARLALSGHQQLGPERLEHFHRGLNLAGKQGRPRVFELHATVCASGQAQGARAAGQGSTIGTGAGFKSSEQRGSECVRTRCRSAAPFLDAPPPMVSPRQPAARRCLSRLRPPLPARRRGERCHSAAHHHGGPIPQVRYSFRVT